MVQSEDTYISSLLGELKELFPSQKTTSLTPAPTSTGGYQAPLKGSWNNSGGFDASGALRPNGRKGHGGVDMRAPAGTSIYPMAPGVVSSVGTDPLGGNVVNVQHADNVRTYYAHCSTVKVQKGDKVDYDTVLGTVGETGNAKGTVPHCHFQVWKDNQLQDPARYFTVPKYTNLSEDEKKNGLWSEKARQEAAAFNMSEHVQKGRSRVAFTSDVDQLLKIAHQFYKLTSG